MRGGAFSRLPAPGGRPCGVGPASRRRRPIRRRPALARRDLARGRASGNDLRRPDMADRDRGDRSNPRDAASLALRRVEAGHLRAAAARVPRPAPPSAPSPRRYRPAHAVRIAIGGEGRARDGQHQHAGLLAQPWFFGDSVPSRRRRRPPARHPPGNHSARAARVAARGPAGGLQQAVQRRRGSRPPVKLRGLQAAPQPAPRWGVGGRLAGRVRVVMLVGPRAVHGQPKVPSRSSTSPASGCGRGRPRSSSASFAASSSSSAA